MTPLPWEYLLSTSRTSLKDMHLNKLAICTSRRKELRSVVEEWIEARAHALFIEWPIEHGEEIAVALLEGRVPRVEEETGESEPDVVKPFRYEFWRSERRHARRKAG